MIWRMVSKDECTFDNEVMKWFIGVMVVLCGASLAYFMSDAGFSGMFAKQQTEGAKATVRLADGCSREVTHVIDTFGREGRCLAVLDAKCVRGDEGGSGYRILFSSDISPEEADRFIARAYGLCLRREASPFTLSFDLLDCPRWADACKAYIERSLAEQGLAVAYDSGVYERERPLVTRYLRDVLGSRQQPSAALTSVKLWDFYLDERPSGERGRNILGEVSMSVSPGKLPQPLLSEKPALPPGDHWTPLHLAAECGDEAELAALLSAGADPNARSRTGITPPELAALNGHEHCLRALLTAGAVADARAAQRAALEGHADCLRALLERLPEEAGARRSFLQEPLQAAAARGHVECLRLLLEAGADAEAPDAEGMRPLDWAVACGHPAAMELLVRAGADVDGRDAEGRTLIRRAMEQGSAVRLRALLELGANPRLADAEGRTPLHAAAADRSLHWACPLLLEGGADPNARDARGDTPLHPAARCGDRALMRLLTAGGADGHLKNKDGQSAEELLQELLKLRQAQRGWLEVKGMVTIPDACSLSSVTVCREAGQLLVKESPDGPALTPDQFRTRLTRMLSRGGEWVILFRLQDSSQIAELEPWLSVCDALRVRSRCTEE